MTGLIFLIPLALLLGLSGLGAFLWCVKNGQFEDLEGDGCRILESEDAPLSGGD